jgi:hypothetical protein
LVDNATRVAALRGFLSAAGGKAVPVTAAATAKAQYQHQQQQNASVLRTITKAWPQVLFNPTSQGNSFDTKP